MNGWALFFRGEEIEGHQLPLNWIFFRSILERIFTEWNSRRKKVLDQKYLEFFQIRVWWEVWSRFWISIPSSPFWLACLFGAGLFGCAGRSNIQFLLMVSGCSKRSRRFSPSSTSSLPRCRWCGSQQCCSTSGLFSSPLFSVVFDWDLSILLQFSNVPVTPRSMARQVQQGKLSVTIAQVWRHVVFSVCPNPITGMPIDLGPIRCQNQDQVFYATPTFLLNWFKSSWTGQWSRLIPWVTL